jgi:hypothetical protein
MQYILTITVEADTDDEARQIAIERLERGNGYELDHGDD